MKKPYQLTEAQRTILEVAKEHPGWSYERIGEVAKERNGVGSGAYVSDTFKQTEISPAKGPIPEQIEEYYERHESTNQEVVSDGSEAQNPLGELSVEDMDKLDGIRRSLEEFGVGISDLQVGVEESSMRIVINGKIDR